MFCINCSHQLNGNERFCPACCAPVETAEKINTDKTKQDRIREVLVACKGDKLTAIKQVHASTGWSLSDSMAAVDAALRVTPPEAFAAQAQAIVDQRIQENAEKAIACCPKCGSTSLTASKKGFGVGKEVVGSALMGDIGLVAGNIGAKKVWVTCLNCGHRWKL